jgi:hypothetical protein
MSITDLADDELHGVLRHCLDYSMFTSLVCKSFRRAVAMIDHPCPVRMVHLGRVFEREEFLHVFLGDRSFMKLVAPRWSSSEERVIEWSSTARRLALSYGSPNVIKLILRKTDFLTAATNAIKTECFSTILAAGKINLFHAPERLCALGHKTLSKAMAFFVDDQSEMLPTSASTYGAELRSHCAALVYPACKADSTDTLEWIVDTVQQKALMRPCNWDRMFQALSGVTKSMVEYASTSRCAYAMLDMLYALFVANAQGKTLVKSGMIICLAMFKLRMSGSAWQWMRDACNGTPLNEIIRKFRLASLSRQTHCTLHVPENELIMDSNNFCVRDLEAHRIVADGIAPGGWLYKSFSQAVGECTDFDMYTIHALKRHKTATGQVDWMKAGSCGVWLDRRADELLEHCACNVMASCEEDVYGSSDRMRRAMHIVSELSFYTAYRVFRRFRHLSKDRRTRLAQAYNKLQVDALVLCANTEMVEVAYDFNTAVNCGTLRLSSKDVKAVLHGLVEHRVQNSGVLRAVVLGCCRNSVTARDAVCAAMSANVCMFQYLVDAIQSVRVSGLEVLRANVANYLIENYTSFFKTVGESTAYRIIEVCMEKGCFARGSDQEIFAMQQLSSMVSGEDRCNLWRKRRTLPDFQRAQRVKLY